jgi:hypothetical protein
MGSHIACEDSKFEWKGFSDPEAGVHGLFRSGEVSLADFQK